jgi:hypothetical protein
MSRLQSGGSSILRLCESGCFHCGSSHFFIARNGLQEGSMDFAEYVKEFIGYLDYDSQDVEEYQEFGEVLA